MLYCGSAKVAQKSVGKIDEGSELMGLRLGTASFGVKGSFLGRLCMPRPAA